MSAVVAGRNWAKLWAADACLCGCPRSAHPLGKPGRWPATGRRHGRCTTCETCTGFDIDNDALAAAEAAVAAANRAAHRAMLADPYFGKRRPDPAPRRAIATPRVEAQSAPAGQATTRHREEN